MASAAVTPTVTARRQSGNSAVLGSLLVAAAGLVFMGALCGSYVSVRNFIGIGKDGFIPSTMKFNNYTGVMTLMSALGASLAAEWALISAKVLQRRWALAGYGLAGLLQLGAANAAWFIGSGSALVAADSSYATLFYAIIACTVGLLMLGFVATVVALFRTMGGQIWGSDFLLGRASNVLIHLGTAAAAAMFFLIFTYK
jgi:hypothetical protein